MKQSEKYDLLQYALWCLVYHSHDNYVYGLEPDRKYSFGSHHATGADLIDMWLEEKEGQDE